MDLVQPSFVPHGYFTFPRASQLLLIGPPGDTKAKLAIRYLLDRIAQSEQSIYATTVLTPLQVRTSSTSLGSDSSSLRIIDGIAALSSSQSNEEFVFKSLSELNSVSLTILQALQGVGNGHLCIDSLSTLMIYSEPSSVLKFARVISAKAKAAGITGLYILEEGVHEQQVETTLKYIVDGVIQTSDFETDSGIEKVVRMEFVRGMNCNSTWLRFSETGDFTPLII